MSHRPLVATTILVLILATALPTLAAPAPQDSCDCEVQRPPVLAIVNGVQIPTSQIEADTAEFVKPIKERMATIREKALQTVITNKLIEVEAAKRGISTPRLLQEEVIAKAGEPTEEELRAFYSHNQSSMPGAYDDIKEQLKLYIRSQRQQVQMTILTTDLRSSAKIEVLDYSPAAPTSEADRAKILAIVNGAKITLGELEDNLRGVMYELRLNVYDLEYAALERRIDEVLITQEATRRGTTAKAIIDAEVAPKARKIDAFDVSKFYNENKERFGGRPLAEVKPDLTVMLQEHEVQLATHEYAKGLEKGATIKIGLVEPAPPTYSVDVAGRPSVGPATAPVTIVIFSDFQCPKCAATHAALANLVKTYAGKVRVVARNFPLEQHEFAYTAAVASEAAFEQGKYWEYADLLFANQSNLSAARLKELATQAGLDRAKFDAALDSPRFADLVDRDLTDGTRVGVGSTPAVFVNGRPVAGDTADQLRAAVESALGKG